MNINEKLYSDAVSGIISEVHLVNQNHEINEYNKPGIRYLNFDSYTVTKMNSDYSCQYTYDIKSPSIDFRLKPLILDCYDTSAGKSLSDFVLSVLTAPGNIMIRSYGLDSTDYRSLLLDIKEIEINNAIIDELALITIKRYFKKLEKLTINYSNIKTECNFSNIDVDLKIQNSTIKNTRSLNDCNSKIELYHSVIEKISPTVINSKEIYFNKYQNHNLKELFLICSFPNLKKATFNPNVTTIHKSFSYEDGFTFLPFSAPNLECLFIEGSVKNFDFLYNFKNLSTITMQSKFNTFGAYYAYATDKSKRDAYYKKNQLAFNVSKILNSDMDDNTLLSNIELENIKNRISLNKQIHFTEEEKRKLLSGFDPIRDITFDNREVRKYYHLKYDILEYIDTTFSDGNQGEDKIYYMINGFVYQKHYREYCVNKNKEAKFLAFSPKYFNDMYGDVIISKNQKKPTYTVEEALKKAVSPYTHEMNIEQAKNNFLNCLESLKQCEEDLKIGHILDAEIGEGFIINYANLKKLPIEAPEILGLMEKYEVIINDIDYIRKESLIIQKKLEKLIIDNYDKFTHLEKILIYHNNDLYDLSDERRYKKFKKDIYGVEDYIDYSLIDSIDAKTNNMYSKLLNMLKLKYKLYLSIENPYNSVKVPNEFVKKMKIN